MNGGCFLVLMWFGALALYVYGVCMDAANGLLTWLLADLFFPPIGIVRGLMWLFS